jgi:hypothetical protein
MPAFVHRHRWHPRHAVGAAVAMGEVTASHTSGGEALGIIERAG